MRCEQVARVVATRQEASGKEATRQVGNLPAAVVSAVVVVVVATLGQVMHTCLAKLS